MTTVSESDLEVFEGSGVESGGSDLSETDEVMVDGALARKAGPATSADAITREQRRSRRKREIRARTISVKRMTKREIEIGRMLYPETDYYKPRARGECVDGPRPCPYVSCQHHLYLDVSPRTGAIKLNFPDLEVWEMNETCALDVADRGGTTLEDVGAIMNLTRERIRRLPVLSKPVEDDEDEDEDESAEDDADLDAADDLPERAAPAPLDDVADFDGVE
jgi:hypothetical protein